MTNSPSNRATVADDRIYLTNRLQALLKHYSPQALSWAGELGSLQAIDFLARWPRLEAMQKASPEEVRDFYRSHGCRLGAKLPERLAEISAARPLITDRAFLNASITMLQALLEPLRGLIAGITSFDRQIEASYERHPDKEVFNSLPGAGPVLAPRLLAAFGADRGRYQSAEEIQCFSGIAPVIERSGTTKFVHRRLACPVIRPPELPRVRPEFDPLSRGGRGPTTINSGGVATSTTKRSGPWPTSGHGLFIAAGKTTSLTTRPSISRDSNSVAHRSPQLIPVEAE